MSVHVSASQQMWAGTLIVWVECYNCVGGQRGRSVCLCERVVECVCVCELNSQYVWADTFNFMGRELYLRGWRALIVSVECLRELMCVCVCVSRPVSVCVCVCVCVYGRTPLIAGWRALIVSVCV